MSTNRFLQRAVFTTVAAGGIAMLTGGIASAHVTANVYGDEPTKGGYGAIVLRVPNEEKDAGTSKIELTVKPEYAISSLRTKPIPGWTAEVIKTQLPAPVKTKKGAEVTEAVTKVVWTAQPGNEIKAGSSEYQEFEFSGGPLPDVDELLLPAAQTYTSGKVVNWDQPTPPSGEEPDKPAPTVKLGAESENGHGAHGGTAEGEKAEGHDDSAASAGTDNTARWLGGAGLAVGALGLGAGAGATLRAKKAGAKK